MKYKKYLGKLLTKYDKEQLINEFENFLENKYKQDLSEIEVPVSVFCGQLSPFESLVKFLHEHEKQGFSEIGQLLRKDRRVIWITYKRASEKFNPSFEIKEDEIKIPISALISDQLSIAELVVFYLKEKLQLKNSQISSLIKKDTRTIWTLYHRAVKKRGEPQ